MNANISQGRSRTNRGLAVRTVQRMLATSAGKLQAMFDGPDPDLRRLVGLMRTHFILERSLLITYRRSMLDRARNQAREQDQAPRPQSLADQATEPTNVATIIDSNPDILATTVDEAAGTLDTVRSTMTALAERISSIDIDENEGYTRDDEARDVLVAGSAEERIEEGEVSVGSDQAEPASHDVHARAVGVTVRLVEQNEDDS